MDHHKVARGDTLLRLSWEYGVSPDAIRAANHLRSDALPVGTDLLIPKPATVNASPEEPILQARQYPRLCRPNPSSLGRSHRPTGERFLQRAWNSRPLRQPQKPRSPESLTLLARSLAGQDISYNALWTPPGCHSPWRMDCSNTTRYLYIAAAGIDLGRTASDQYEFLRKRGCAWRAPADWHGVTDVERLGARLKAGDVLFWENTYRPERRSSITHVMVFLGADEQGHWLMAGSRGHHAGGPGVYRFDPHQPAGGFSSFFGLIRHEGRFFGFGRPLS